MQNRVGRVDFFFFIHLLSCASSHVTMQANKSQNDERTQLQLWKEPLFSTFNVFLLFSCVFRCLFLFYIVTA